ncbi:phage distal tail protein, Rcc01695 family [Maricaulis sp. CAU 1757]
MTPFHEVDFPFAVALGASGGPERRTEVVTLVSGREERNTPWADSRRRYEAGPGVRRAADLATLIAFFEARRGRLCGFRFRDPLDHASCGPGEVVTASDQVLGTGDGAETVFQLVKRYESGPESWTRDIAKPVPGSVVVAVDGAVVAADADATTGQVTLAAPPPTGAVVSAGFQFDVPVRFDTDRLAISLEAVGAGEAVSVPLVEIRP